MSASFVRKPWFLIPIGVVTVLIFFTLVSVGSSNIDATLTEFIEDARAGRIETVEVGGRNVYYKLIGGEVTFKTKVEEGDTVRLVLQDAGIELEDFPPIKTKERNFWSRIPLLIIGFLPIILIIGILVALLRWLWSIGGTRARGRDPVCGKRVRQKDAAGDSTFQDITYRFCSSECKQRFDADPVSYLLKS